jgi:hypothetical protein
MLFHLNQWLDSLKHYALMCLLMSGPDRLPGNIYNVLISLLCYCLIGFALVDAERSYATILAQIGLELLLLALLCYWALKLKNLLLRLVQTFSALLGVNLIITLVSIPIYRSMISDSIASNSLSISALLIYLAIVPWNLVVISSIFKKAFDVNKLQAAMTSIAYFFVYLFMVSWFF